MAFPTYGVTYDYYTNDYMGTELEEVVFDRLLSRTMDIIYPMVRVRAEILLGKNEYIDEQLKRAICSQVEYMNIQTGGTGDISGMISSSEQSFSLGKFSATQGGSKSRADLSLSGMTSPKAMQHLMMAGLIDNRIGVVQYDRY